MTFDERSGSLENLATDEGHLSAPAPSVPEDHVTFRLAQLALLLEAARNESAPIRTIDRLGLYDFLCANPFVAISGDDRRDAQARTSLRLAGFSSTQLAYASTGQRYASRRRRLQGDLSLLLAYGLMVIDERGYSLSGSGSLLAEQLTSLYADQFRASARLVLSRLRRLSDKRLHEQANDWLGKSWLLVDVLDDVFETIPSSPTGNYEGGADGQR